jgi:hypothetical protein
MLPNRPNIALWITKLSLASWIYKSALICTLEVPRYKNIDRANQLGCVEEISDEVLRLLGCSSIFGLRPSEHGDRTPTDIVRSIDHKGT